MTPFEIENRIFSVIGAERREIRVFAAVDNLQSQKISIEPHGDWHAGHPKGHGGNLFNGHTRLHLPGMCRSHGSGCAELPREPFKDTRKRKANEGELLLDSHRHVISRLVPLTPFRAVSLKTCLDWLLLQQLCTATQFAVHPHDDCSPFPQAQSPQNLEGLHSIASTFFVAAEFFEGFQKHRYPLLWARMSEVRLDVTEYIFHVFQVRPLQTGPKAQPFGFAVRDF